MLVKNQAQQILRPDRWWGGIEEKYSRGQRRAPLMKTAAAPPPTPTLSELYALTLFHT